MFCSLAKTHDVPVQENICAFCEDRIAEPVPILKINLIFQVELKEVGALS